MNLLLGVRQLLRPEADERQQQADSLYSFSGIRIIIVFYIIEFNEKLKKSNNFNI